MTVVTYSYARQNLAKLMDEVEQDRAPVYISRQKKRGAAVLMSLEDYEAIETTMHLLGNPANAARLRKSIADLDAGKGIERDIIPVKASGKSKKPRK
ncbi:MAG TPA: type II toxin-antitoxin system prevent-host-death family antitoxin [Rhizomicrobium sp.]|jgi:antitoxin YefM|nr:type II toxin-antitoxin system prevent-host-death family antitoxin [Rhizomicrobium sp.]